MRLCSSLEFSVSQRFSATTPSMGRHYSEPTLLVRKLTRIELVLKTFAAEFMFEALSSKKEPLML